LLTPHVTFAPDVATPSRGRVVVYLPHGQADEVGEHARRMGFPTGDHRTVRAAVPTEAGPRVISCPAIAVPLSAALDVLLAGVRTTPSWDRSVETGAVLSAAARLALRLVAAELCAPALVHGPDEGVHAAWRALPDANAESRAALGRLSYALPPAGHALEIADGRIWHAEALLRALLDAVADLCGRVDEGDVERPGRPRARLLPWTARWAEALVDPVDPSVPLREDAADVIAGIDAWFGTDRGADAGFTELRLSAPPGQDDPWLLELGVRTPDGELVDASQVWTGEAHAADGDAALLAETLLRGLGRAARVFDPIDQVLRSAAPERLALDLDQAWDFIREVTPLLEGSDVIVVLPDDLVESPPRIRLRVGDDEAVDEEPGEDGALLPDDPDAAGSTPFRWEVALGDEVLSPDQLDDLLSRNLPLVRWQDRWVRVAPEVRERLAALSDGTMPLVEAMLLGLAGSAPVGAVPGAPADRDDAVEVVAGGRIAALVERLRTAGDALVATDPPPGFVGELRPYQQRGVAWLGGMADLGLGAILADSMGLGKTIQLIAHLLRQGAEGPHLVVCPTSVVGNWEREVARFAPGLEVTRFHGTDRPTDLTGVRGVVVTSYGVVRRDVDVLAEVDWDIVTLDEAQHVKNPSTAGAKAVRRLVARQVVVLTGTPLENRLAELWSLLDVTNRGLLGSRGRFGRRYVAPIERRRDPEAATRLRRVVAPLILRREKDDPAVVSDLPPKIERTVVCSLTPEQAELYQVAVDRILGAGQRTDGALAAASTMERRGRILALLTELKQICNHPAQYLRQRDPSRAKPTELLGRSGKLAVAREIVRDAVTAADRVLLFTQYVGMGDLLVAQLSLDLGVDIPFLHGGVSASNRDRMVAAFQREGGEDGPPVLVVSLRAGGTGLNLTAATHVVHYDRWWNPAVEDQATDRAHRIGQHRTVEVHKLVTTGTVEERVADLLERKRALADTVVGAGEQWITELGESELRELVALSASGEELDDDPFEDDERWDSAEEPLLPRQDPVGASTGGRR
jgi:hypothetical protein